MVENVPTGSAISVEDTGDAVTYSWPPAERHPLQQMVAFFGGAIVFMGCLMPPFFAAVGAQRGHIEVPLNVPFVFAGINFAIGGLLLYSGLARRGRETLRLSPEFVEFDSGPTVLPFPLMLLFGGTLFAQQFMPGVPMPIVWRRKQYRMPVTDLGPFTLERVGERQRLRVDHRSERIEIGSLLREPEREWLADQLLNWQSLVQRGEHSGVRTDTQQGA